MNPINIYTDGACLGNPGPGAYAYLIEYSHRIDASAQLSRDLTTNNKMELQAVISALESIKPFVREKAKVTLFSDSKYVVDGVNTYIATWLQNGWKTSTRKDVANMDQWKHLVALRSTFNHLTFEWVKGHASCHYNNICDAMAQKLLTTNSVVKSTHPDDSAYEN